MYNDFTTRRKIIIDANRNYHKKTRICQSDKQENNENCDDFVSLDLEVNQGRITKIHFCAKGCALLIASCYLLEKNLINKSVFQATQMLNEYQKMIKNSQINKNLQDLNAFVMVKNHPNRIACVKLAANLLFSELRSYEKIA